MSLRTQHDCAERNTQVRVGNLSKPGGLHGRRRPGRDAIQRFGDMSPRRTAGLRLREIPLYYFLQLFIHLKWSP